LSQGSVTGGTQLESVKARTGSRSAAETGSSDLTRAESVAIAIRRAFPFPQSGAFADLLAALEDEPQA
jgi:hypothetical protein